MYCCTACEPNSNRKRCLAHIAHGLNRFRFCNICLFIWDDFSLLVVSKISIMPSAWNFTQSIEMKSSTFRHFSRWIYVFSHSIEFCPRHHVSRIDISLTEAIASKWNVWIPCGCKLWRRDKQHRTYNNIANANSNNNTSRSTGNMCYFDWNSNLIVQYAIVYTYLVCSAPTQCSKLILRDYVGSNNNNNQK